MDDYNLSAILELDFPVCNMTVPDWMASNEKLEDIGKSNLPLDASW